MINRRKFLGLSLLTAPFLLAKDGLAQKFEQSSKMTVKMPAVISTWDSGRRANDAAWPILIKRGNAIDAVEAASIAAESEQSCCVGLTANPDRDGKVTLDASIMNGNGDCGSVAFLERIKHPISVARRLMETTPHVLLAGSGAQQFAIENGFKLEEEKLSPEAEKEWKKWLEKSEYKPIINVENIQERERGPSSQFAPYYLDDGSPNHDTMSTIALDASGKLAGSVTTSGMGFKMRGRIGDSPVIGAGLFVDNEVGAATTSGVGEEVIRICGTHTIIELMRFGRSPEAACREAINRIVKRDPVKAKEMQVGFIAISRKGEIGAFSINKNFSYCVTNEKFPNGNIFESKSYF